MENPKYKIGQKLFFRVPDFPEDEIIFEIAGEGSWYEYPLHPKGGYWEYPIKGKANKCPEDFLFPI